MVPNNMNLDFRTSLVSSQVTDIYLY